MWSSASWDARVRSYLGYSLGLHVLAGLLLLKFMAGSSAQETKIYSIDFISNAATIIGPAGGAAATPAPAAAAKAPAPAAASLPKTTEKPDEFATTHRRRRRFALPLPSLLGGLRVKAEATPPLPAVGAPPSAELPSSAGSPGPATPGEAGVAADMPDFPFPWYITQVRALLWNKWMSRSARGSGETVVVFTIMPNGQVVDVRTEESSSDAAFDLAGLGAVQDAAPFPPLPKGYKEPFLRVHATLKSL